MTRLLLAAALVLTLAPAARAHGNDELRWHGKTWAGCRMPFGTDHEIVRLIRCAADHYPVDIPTALRIAQAESGLEASADNGGCCAGVFQQHRSYWAGRLAAYNRSASWNLQAAPSVFNGRANVLVSVWMAHHAGWGAWSTY